jgi:hypothetical protein
MVDFLSKCRYSYHLKYLEYLVFSDIFRGFFGSFCPNYLAIELPCCWRDALSSNLPTDMHNFEHLNITTQQQHLARITQSKEQQ